MDRDEWVRLCNAGAHSAVVAVVRDAEIAVVCNAEIAVVHNAMHVRGA